MKANRVRHTDDDVRFEGGNAMAIPYESEKGIFSLIHRYRAVVWTSPLWVALTMILLSSHGDLKVQAVINFLTGNPTK
jgi:hypothetical protein